MKFISGLQKVKRNGQVTIPKEIRNAFQLQEGDFLKAEISDEGILLRVIDLEIKSRKQA